MKQYEQAGLADKLPLYTVFTVDAISLPKLQQANMKAVLGSLTTGFWGPGLENPQNARFVEGFLKKYGRYPSFYAAQSYDSIFLINSAVESVGGNLQDRDGMRAAMEKADFPSVRGSFSYGANHFPIQNFYLLEVVADGNGNWTTEIRSTVFENHQDTYVADCDL